MKNHVQPGKVITVTAPYDLEPGDGCLVGSIFGVASHKALSGAPVEIQTQEVFKLKKTNAVTFAEGAKVSWDNATKATLAPATGKFLIGAAIDAAAGGDATVSVRLDGIAVTAQP